MTICPSATIFFQTFSHFFNILLFAFTTVTEASMLWIEGQCVSHCASLFSASTAMKFGRITLRMLPPKFCQQNRCNPNFDSPKKLFCYDLTIKNYCITLKNKRFNLLIKMNWCYKIIILIIKSLYCCDSYRARQYLQIASNYIAIYTTFTPYFKGKRRCINAI